ncbi:MAG: sugar phosphate isomerase/epimerase [Prolixibacteraceae bacterium]|jgi:sugar phosphate isomerase/epimerase|nr:sugar phosphate isomerase/epimerase [Prolixibacteraceae bacterium]MBT6007592.1 sugar phosphate isomerase/epimerase [Prolixibacteraceae bacterium]MBT6764861.1 sugar phosphate isomerase/epimerase [Prolixibacteraceae bacterium]MBT6997103.1 sugar phosphate isomerase/epimerase [Prolixibacteraceae bacterium]MBT7393364.1 sugar phosphate isomerase/epimerase [Prolixibacteraceae bacterium]
MLDLGFVSAILAEKSFKEVIEFASANQFKCVEIMCWPKGKAERRYAGVTHINVDEIDDAKVIEIKSILEKNKVYISGLGYYPNPLDDDKNQSVVYIEHIKKVIVAAAKLGIPVVNTFVGRDSEKSVEDNLEKFAEVWPGIIKVAEENKVKIGIENCPMLFTRDEWPGGKNLATTPAIWKKMFEIIPSPAFGLNYDPSHLVWQQMDEVKPIYDFSEKLFHIHLKDVKMYRDKLNEVGIMAYPLDYHSPKIPGLGDVNWRGFFSALTSVKYRGPVCIEVEDKAFEGSEEDVKAAILTSRNYLKQFLG